MMRSIEGRRRPFFSPQIQRRVVVLQRFETVIAGRSYLIEVALVAENRWRAQIVRIPGVPVALMPFYGETADQAATQLSNWLTRAHQHAGTTL